MAEARGTLEALLGELTKLLAPLTSLSVEAAPAVLPELGLPVRGDQAIAIASVLGNVTSSLRSLIDLDVSLEASIEIDASGKVSATGVLAMDRVTKLIGGFAKLGSALAGLGLPGAGPILAKFPDHLFGYLFATYFRRSPFAVPLLELAGLLERIDHNVGSLDPRLPFFTTNLLHLGRFAGWLAKPAIQLANLYDWGKPGFDGTKLLSMIDRLVGELGLPTLYDPIASPVTLDLLVARLTVKQGGLHAILGGLPAVKLERATSRWSGSIGLDVEVPADTELLIKPGSIEIKPPDATTLSGKASATYHYTRTAADPLVLLSIAGGSKITVEQVSASLALIADKTGSARVELGAELAGGRVLITTENADGFLASLLGGVRVENTFDLGLGFSIADGLHFQGSSALEIQLASHVGLGKIDLDRLTLSVGIAGGAFPVAITTDITAKLGPLRAVIQDVGFEITLALVDGNAGKLGPLDLSAAFKPPTGVGLSLDAGIVRGGGFLQFDDKRGQYAGALQLEIAGIIGASAIGVITTNKPDGSKGSSLVVIIAAEFSPALQLGYGFTLDAVGGLLGLDRGMDLIALRNGVRSGAVEHVMFPHDVIANAPQLISDLSILFPPEEDAFLIGPMAKLGWGTPTLVTIAFGVIVEMPGAGSPPTIGLIGAVALALPTAETALVRIQMGIAGTIDFDKGLLAIDAELYDSFLQALALEGRVAVRVKWKQAAGFLISAGGFHPSYQPPAELEVASTDRLAINILNKSAARIRVELYFALTSNTVQTGARAEIYFGFSDFYVEGHLGFDALFQFSPFRFKIGISASVTLHVIGVDVLSIGLGFKLSGPSPWHAWGSGSASIMFWDISVDIDSKWGETTDTTLPDIAVLPILLADFDAPARWRALPPASAKLWVTLRPIAVGDTALVLHPAGKLSVVQKVAPLDLTWEKFGYQRPSDIDRASITKATSGAVTFAISPLDDQFARSQFEELSDAEKLSSPEFETMHNGAVLGPTSDALGGTVVERTIEYETIVIDKERKPPMRTKPITAFHRTHLAGTAKKRSAYSRATKRRLDPYPDPVDKIQTTGEVFAVASQADNTPHVAQPFASEASARDFLARAVADDPALAGKLHVIPMFEVAA